MDVKEELIVVIHLKVCGGYKYLHHLGLFSSPSLELSRNIVPNTGNFGATYDFYSNCGDVEMEPLTTAWRDGGRATRTHTKNMHEYA